MYYRSNTSTESDLINVEDAELFDGVFIKDDIKHLVKLIVNDEKKDAPLKKESFVVAIQGGWGTGKTWASWAFINHLETKLDIGKKYHVHSFELLPFANINESVTNVLGTIASELWDDGIVDVRDELKQMTIDSTPAQEFNAGMSLFGLSLSKKLTLNSNSERSKQKLGKKFERLSKQGHRFVILLDELDRLKPDEVVVVTRMIDSFKNIPGIIFVLPFNREVVAGSIQESLVLSATNAHIFLRKFIKASLTIQLDVENLKNSFTKELVYSKTTKNSKALKEHFGKEVGDIVWYLLLNILLVRESISAMSDNPNGNTVALNYNNNEASNYLHKLPQTLGLAKNPQSHPEVSSFPFLTDNKWQRFSNVYGALSEPTGNVEETIRQLKSMYSEDMLANTIYTDVGLIEELRTRGEIDYDATRDQTLSKSTVFETIVIPNIEGNTHEPFLTNNYSRRDMQQLANAICNDPYFKIASNPVEFILVAGSVVRKRFLEFR